MSDPAYLRTLAEHAPEVEAEQMRLAADALDAARARIAELERRQPKPVRDLITALNKQDARIAELEGALRDRDARVGRLSVENSDLRVLLLLAAGGGS